MSSYKLGCFSIVSILSSCLVACGGGSGGSDSPTAGTSSSSVSSAAAPTPAKTAAEAFQDMYGVKPGIYEMLVLKLLAFLSKATLHSNQSNLFE